MPMEVIDGEQMADLQRLSVLQHQGAATVLREHTRTNILLRRFRTCLLERLAKCAVDDVCLIEPPVRRLPGDNRYRDVPARPPRRYGTIASPTSTGNGVRSCSLPLPRISISPARQKMSSSRQAHYRCPVHLAVTLRTPSSLPGGSRPTKSRTECRSTPPGFHRTGLVELASPVRRQLRHRRRRRSRLHNSDSAKARLPLSVAPPGQPMPRL